MYHGDNGRPSRMVRRDEVLASRPELAEVWGAADAAFPVRVTRSFWSRVDPSDPSDPLVRQVLPDPRELERDPGDVEDPVGDAVRSPVPWVVHKYPRRVLLLVTKRCHLYCRYCFRRNHEPGEGTDPSPQEWEAALEYVAGADVEEVILSGGDPLVLRDQQLLATLDRLRHVPVVRIHTRAPITFPERVTDSLAAGLAARAPVWVVVHCNHPRELAPDVDEALARLIGAGIPVLNQAVLLRGVNDDVDTLAALCEALVRRRVLPYYLHLTDRARGNGHLRVGADEGLRLVEALRHRVSGVAFPRFVVDPPDGSGKVDVASWAG